MVRHSNEENGGNEESGEKNGLIDNTEEKKDGNIIMVCIRNSHEFMVLNLLF